MIQNGIRYVQNAVPTCETVRGTCIPLVVGWGTWHCFEEKKERKKMGVFYENKLND